MLAGIYASQMMTRGNLSIYLKFNNGNGSAVFTDNSPFNRAITNGGFVIQSSAQFISPPSSMFVNNIGEHVETTFDDGLSWSGFSTDRNATMEFDIYLTTLPSVGNLQGVVSNRASPAKGFEILINSDGNIIVLGFNAAGVAVLNFLAATALTINVWAHITITKTFEAPNNTWRVYKNGVLLPSPAVQTEDIVNDNSQPYKIGASSNPTRYIKGYLDEFKFRQGYAKTYT